MLYASGMPDARGLRNLALAHTSKKRDLESEAY